MKLEVKGLEKYLTYRNIIKVQNVIFIVLNQKQNKILKDTEFCRKYKFSKLIP